MFRVFSFFVEFEVCLGVSVGFVGFLRYFEFRYVMGRFYEVISFWFKVVDFFER